MCTHLQRRQMSENSGGLESITIKVLHRQRKYWKQQAGVNVSAVIRRLLDEEQQRREGKLEQVAVEQAQAQSTVDQLRNQIRAIENDPEYEYATECLDILSRPHLLTIGIEKINNDLKYHLKQDDTLDSLKAREKEFRQTVEKYAPQLKELDRKLQRAVGGQG